MPGEVEGHPDQSCAYYFIRPTWLAEIDPGAGECVLAYAAAQRATGRPLIVLIGGPSCSGKSSLAIEMALGLGIRTVVASDTVRVVAAAFSSSPSILSYFSHETWRARATEYDPQALVEGFQDQARAMLPHLRAVVQHSIRHVQNTVIEGIHLTPEIVTALGEEGRAHIVPLYVLITKRDLASKFIPLRAASTYMHRPAGKYADRLERLHTLIDWWWTATDRVADSRVENTTSPEACRAAAYGIVISAIRAAVRVPRLGEGEIA